MEIILDLLKQYGWQSVVVAVITVVLIELIKPFARKFFKNEKVRHTLYTALTFVFCLAVTSAMAAIMHQMSEVFTLYGSSMTVLLVLTPIVANTGFLNWIEDLFKGLFENGNWKKAMKELGKMFGVDVSILDKVATKVEEEYLPLIKECKDAFFVDNKEELILNIKQKLAGFVENGRLQELAECLFEKLKNSWTSGKSIEREKNLENKEV